MKKCKISLLLFAFLGLSQWISAQAVSSIFQTGKNQNLLPSCGSFHLMEHADKKQPGFMAQSNELMREISKLAQHEQRNKRSETITIPVVFHVLFNDSSENLPDSVLMNQIDVLNQAFSHSHTDTANIRDEFKNRIGKAKIQFELAEFDPNGNPTDGIVRKATDIEHFGGTLPYAPNQQAEIQKWVADSFFYNLFRATNSEKGGSDEWDPYTYLNIWIGDMRIYEPKFNDLEELVFVGIATPPENHENWPTELLPQDISATGVMMHYVSVGGNNANSYPNPYGVLNGTVKQGKIAVHEVGHYLGLRHIWGDAPDCATDDFIDDTPASRSQSNFQCPLAKNTCIDSNENEDLPDMIENYMDYSSGECATAFTQEQAALMRIVYKNYRQWPASAPEITTKKALDIYPNPGNGRVNFNNLSVNPLSIQLRSLDGKLIKKIEISGEAKINLNVDSGLYLLQISTGKSFYTEKLVIH